MRFAFKHGLLFLVFCLSFSTAFAALTLVEKISTPANTNSVEIALSQSVDYHYFYLTSPDRLVIDFKKTEPITIQLPAFSTIPVIKHVRVATYSTDTQRVVFELAKSVKASFNLTQPSSSDWRLLIQFPLTKPVAKPEKIYADLKKDLKQDETAVIDDVDHIDRAEQSSSLKINATTKTADMRKSHCISIVIDPGHGGHDPGAVGRHGTKEKNVTLAISKYLNTLINNTPGMCAYLTRSSDVFVSLRGRLSIARKKTADLFIAIHADNFNNTTARGATVFALSQHGATNEAARWLAHNENVDNFLEIGDLKDNDKDLQSVLMDISQNETINRSLILGKDVLTNLDAVSKLHHTIVEQAGFVVLKAPDIPSILVETGFLSNDYEEKLLSQPEYQQKIARAIYNGVMEYSKQYLDANFQSSKSNIAKGKA